MTSINECYAFSSLIDILKKIFSVLSVEINLELVLEEKGYSEDNIEL